MEYDIHLMKTSGTDSFTVRLYTWLPYCISLGANQKEDIINKELLLDDGYHLVRRPTGGRAVFHSEELTYSVIINTSLISPKVAYKKINEALLLGLSFYDKRLASANMEEKEINFKEHYKSDVSVACFSVPSKSEVKFDGRKLIGSAQRKIGEVILQHGSINTGSFHKRIIEYLDIDQSERDTLKILLDEKTSDIKSILGGEVDLSNLKRSIVLGFEKVFNLVFENSIVEQESLS
jgi:lipoate-protein ligase A